MNQLSATNTQSQNIVYYHYPCQDGVAGAWCAWNHFNGGTIYTEYIGISPGKYIDIKQYNHDTYKKTAIYFIDVLPTREVIDLCKYVERVVILDHHQTNHDYVRSLPPDISNLTVVFDMERSGAQIAWDYFNSGISRPWFIDYIGDRDLWTWKLPDSRAINSGLLNQGHLDSIDTLDHFYKSIQHLKPKTIIKQIATHGYAIDSYQKKLLHHATKYALYLKFCDDTLGLNTHCWAGTINQDLTSDLGSILSERVLLDETMPMFSVIYTYCPLEDEYRLSLRSSAKYNGFDVSRIAKSLDPRGGGHMHAAGCKISRALFWQYFSNVKFYSSQ